MFKVGAIFILLSCSVLYSKAEVTPVKADSILTFLKLNDPTTREKKLVSYIKAVFNENPVHTLPAMQADMNSLLEKYNFANKAAFKYFIESLCQTRLLQMQKAEDALTMAINTVAKNEDHYLLYAFFSNLGFLQSYLGNTIGAVSSFRTANKEAAILNDPYLQAVIAINISDIYYRNNFYSQSLFYLDKADNFIAKHHINSPRLKNIIYNNKAENFFRTQRVDSLEKYSNILNNVPQGTSRLYLYKNRVNYYLLIAHHQYQKAIGRMLQLQKDTLYQFDGTDQLNLANACFQAGKTDSAKMIVNHLLAAQEQNNHPEIKLHLYRILGAIYEKENNTQQAAYNFKMALTQSEEQMGRLTSVDTISSQIKIDDMQNAYILKEARYKNERVWLIFIAIVALLIIAIGTMVYLNTKQKRYYEKLLYTTKKEELAFIHSHEVRRHLSNIMGIIETIKHSENRAAEYSQAEDYLMNSAESLDAAIKSVSDKLNN